MDSPQVDRVEHEDAGPATAPVAVSSEAPLAVSDQNLAGRAGMALLEPTMRTPRAPGQLMSPAAMLAMQRTAGNRAVLRTLARGSGAILHDHQRRVLARQGVSAQQAGTQATPAPRSPLSVAATAAVAEVRAAMGVAQTEGGGVGDFPRAFRALASLSTDDLLAVVRELAQTHETEVLAAHISEAPTENRPRLDVALEAAVLLDEPPENLNETTVARAAEKLANADPTLRDQILRAIVSAKVGAQMVAMTMEGLGLMMAAATQPALNPSLVGVRGPVGPGTWAPPGNQPIPFYLGTAAHLAIAAEYAIQNPGDLVRTNSFSIARILTDLAAIPGGGTPDRSALDAERLGSEPDIANLTKRHIYEIKPAGAAALARTEAAWYVESFTLAGVPMSLGPAGAPGTTGAVPAPGGVYLYESPEPGVILYQLRRMQVVPVPVPQDAPVRLPRFQLAPLTPQQQQQMVTTMTLGTMALILLAILLSPVGV